jgi:hypothetical protein
MKSDPMNLALVLLVFLNTLAVVQFQALARTNPPGTSNTGSFEITSQQAFSASRS